jgi:hypothetical protein
MTYHSRGIRAVSGERSRSEFDVGALAEGDAGTSTESGEARALGSAGSSEEEDVNGGSSQSGEDDEKNRDDDVSWRHTFGWSGTAQQVCLAMDAFVIVGALALDLAVAGANPAILARAAQRRRARSFLSRVARHFSASLNLDRAVGASASISARNKDAQVSARAVEARIAHRRIVPIFTENCLNYKKIRK